MKLVHIFKSYNDQIIFDDFNYNFSDKGLYLVCGKSGVGKTTLLNIVSGRDKDFRGSVIRDTEVFYFSVDMLVSSFTVRENIELVEDAYPSFKRKKDTFEISAILDKRVDTLSGGEKQRVIVYLAVCSNKKTILLDEPTSSLDYFNKQKVIGVLNRESRKRTIIIVSHERELFEKYTLLDLERGSFNLVDEQGECFQYTLKSHSIKLKKWFNKIVSKNLLSFVIFCVSLFSLVFSLSSFKDEIGVVKTAFEESYTSGEILYKKNDIEVYGDAFYDEVVLPLSKEIIYYGSSVYSYEMYDHKVYLDTYYYGNGFLFSNVYEGENIKEDEAVVSVDIEKFCALNQLFNCNENYLKDLLKGKYLSYDANSIHRLRVKDIIFGDERIYVGDVTSIKEILLQECLEYENKYYIAINVSDEKSFYKKINEEPTLLKYDFIEYLSEDNLIYFLVDRASGRYFSYSELKEDNLVACSNIGVSCDSFSFLNFTSLYYIDDLSVKDMIKYENVRSVKEGEVIISSALANKINKARGESVSLKYYINEEVFVDTLVIVDIIDSESFIIYKEAQYTYEFLYELSGKGIRVMYSYGDSDKYLTRMLLNEEIINETKSLLETFFKVSEIVIYVLYIVIVFLLFFMEYKRNKKNIAVFRVLKSGNVCNINKLVFCLNAIYLSFGLFLIVIDLLLFVIYCFMFILFCYLNKIKIQVSLD